VTRRCLACRAPLEPAQPRHHRMCWGCWRAEDLRRAEPDRTAIHERVAALARTGVAFETARLLVTELGARIVGREAAWLLGRPGAHAHP
jgi:hypothetical protein